MPSAVAVAYRFLLLVLLHGLASDRLNMRLGWFLLVTMEVITVGSFSRSTLSDLLSRMLAVLGAGPGWAWQSEKGGMPGPGAGSCLEAEM